MHFDEAFRQCFVCLTIHGWFFFSVEPVQKRAIFEIICIFL
jgi:hypothetical protein